MHHACSIVYRSIFLLHRSDGIVFPYISKKLVMDKMTDLRDLLKHEIQDLQSAEEQIIESMPQMIEKAKNPELKKALREHLRITEEQKKRLDQVQMIMGEGEEQKEGEKKGLFSRLFSGGQKCKGMEGLITEGQKVMKEDMNEEVLDAAIIASAQRIEHYEITGYGTARAYARELNLSKVEQLLEQTLREEYEADRLLTGMAVGRVNIEAERSGMDDSGKSGSRTSSRSSGSAGRASSAAKSGRSSGAGKSSSKSASTKSASSRPAGSSKSASSKAGSSSRSGSSKAAASKGGSSRSASSNRGSSSSGRATGASKKASAKGSSKTASKSASKKSSSGSSGRTGTSRSSSKSAKSSSRKR
jgi:ferritin-like metal-binding protein YciE